MRLDKVGESKGDVDLFESTPYADSIVGHEAFYHTKPYNSWQMILIGDPLYTPFKTAAQSGSLKISTK